VNSDGDLYAKES